MSPVPPLFCCSGKMNNLLSTGEWSMGCDKISGSLPSRASMLVNFLPTNSQFALPVQTKCCTSTGNSLLCCWDLPHLVMVFMGQHWSFYPDIPHWMFPILQKLVSEGIPNGNHHTPHIWCTPVAFSPWGAGLAWLPWMTQCLPCDFPVFLCPHPTNPFANLQLNKAGSSWRNIQNKLRAWQCEGTIE